ncbi:MAG: polysaccharide biosynthesis C-terminal domain-containing protein [Clostridia bacterium]|nr:polysaccharide biosynthesis C-terminal domain-containing protein [Clostridia bacterium]
MATKDMSVGKPIKVLYAFAVPMIISVLFQQFYNIADSLIAGNFIFDDGIALASVNSAYPVTVVFIAIGNGFGVGGGVVISRIFGAKQYSRTKTSILTALINIFVFALLFTLIGVFTCKPLLSAMNSQDLGDAVFAQSVDYLNVYIYGLTFLFVYNVVSSIFQALGNSKTPLFLLIFSTLLNVIVDIIFVKYFNMGIKGLAWGTFLAQGVASVISLILLLVNISKLPKDSQEKQVAITEIPKEQDKASTHAKDSDALKTSMKKSWKENPIFSLSIWSSIMLMSLPSILQNSTVSIGQLFVQSLVNSFSNPNLVSAYGSAFKINYIIISIFLTISNAMATFTSQNIGANHLDRAKEGLKGGLISMIVIALVSTTLYMALAKQLVGAFISQQNDEIISIGSQFLYILAPFYIVVCIKIIFDGFIRGAGDMAGFTSSTMTDLVIRVGLSYIFVKACHLSYVSIWWSWPIGWVLGTAVSVIFYLSKRWQKTSLKKL